MQPKDKQKKKRANKGILIGAEGDASLQDLDKIAVDAASVEPSPPDQEKPKSNNKKVTRINEKLLPIAKVLYL